MERVPYPNGKELITIKWRGYHDEPTTLALYQDKYVSGGGVALMMHDIDNDEFWGDLTINLPGMYGSFLQDFISKDVIKELKPVFTVLGEFPYNYGTYKMIGIKPEMLNKIPTWDELVEMLNSDDNEIVTL